MVAPAGRVDLGRPSEFARRDDQRIVEHAPVLQVFEQRAIGVVHHRPQVILHRADGGERLRTVDVPGEFVKDGLKHIDRHEAAAALDQPPRQQAPLAEPVPPVFVAERVGLGAELEGFARLGGRHQRVGLLEIGVQKLGVRAVLKSFDGAVDHASQLSPPVDAHGGNVVGRQKVGHLEVRVRRVGIQHEGVERLAEKSGVLPVRHIAAGGPHGARNQNVRRNVALRPQEFGGHATDMRILDAALKEPAGLHHLMPGIVDGCGGVIDGTEHGELVGIPRHARENFRNLHARHVGRERLVGAADFRRRFRLHVPGIQLAGRAQQEDENTVDVFVGLDRSFRLPAEVIGQAHPQQRQRAGMKKIAPPQAVAKFYRLFRIKPKHGCSYSRGAFYANHRDFRACQSFINAGPSYANPSGNLGGLPWILKICP